MSSPAYSRRVMVPLPTHDFEPTETAVPWSALREAGHTVVFATPDGTPSRPDLRVLTGAGFGPLRPWLAARPHARARCATLLTDPAFNAPLPFSALPRAECDAVLLTGGHGPGMRSYLDAPEVHALVGAQMAANKPVAAICHGVLAVARARHPMTGEPSLRGRRSTALTRGQELTAWRLTRTWLADYYRTYARTVQDEVVEALGDPRAFERGPRLLRRENPRRGDYGFTVLDANYLSARYYVDTYRFTSELLALLARCAA